MTKASKFNDGIIAGAKTRAAGKYTKMELLRRVTLANLLFESSYYQSSDELMTQIEKLVPQVDPQDVVSLALECRFEQKLRHTPLWLLLLVQEFHPGYSIKGELAKICTRPDMTMDMLGMLKARRGSLKPIPKGIKKGLALAFDNYDGYQLAKYRRAKSEISLVDVINLVRPVPTKENWEAMQQLVNGTLTAANTWEARLSSGENKAKVFQDLIVTNKLGAMATLRNLRNFKEASLSQKLIKQAISQVNSHWLTPLNFLAAQRNAREYTAELDRAMARCFADYKISGKTILAIDVSGSMGMLTSKDSSFSRMDLAFAMTALATHVFEDLTLVFTAGSDSARKGKHIVWDHKKGMGILNDWKQIYSQMGGGGIFTWQLCEWLKQEGLAKRADRLVVISDSQDIDAYYGKKRVPDTTPYNYSYIIDVSTQTHGIKTDNWTAEINGWSDKLFHYIKEVEVN